MHCGDDIELIMTHQKGPDNKDIHKLAWDTFVEATEIAKKLQISETEVKDTMHIANTHVSLDDPYSNDQDDNALVDYLMDENAQMPDDETFEHALSDDMERALDTLADREKQILSLYFGLGGEEPLTLEEIGQKLGLTRERIRQIKERALEKMRGSLGRTLLKDYY